jgi:hypothetical protein
MHADETDEAFDGLLQAAGLDLTSDERTALEVLHARFAPGRTLIASLDLEETEPATVFRMESL